MKSPGFAQSRRNILGLTAAAAVTTAMPRIASAASAASMSAKTTEGAAKFYPDGRVHPFAGNTVVCHLPQQGDESRAFNEMLDIYREAPWRPYGRRIAFLPPSSYHMTIIGGATDFGREEGKWPLDVPRDVPISECNRIVGERIRSASIERLCTIRMQVDAADTGYDGNTIRIPLEPVDADEFDRIEEFRRSLARAIRIPEPAPGTYQFHMTLGYLLGELAAVELQAVLADLTSWKERIIAAAPVIRFGTPEYCTFEDMFAFERQFFVGSAA